MRYIVEIYDRNDGFIFDTIDVNEREMRLIRSLFHKHMGGQRAIRYFHEDGTPLKFSTSGKIIPKISAKAANNMQTTNSHQGRPCTNS